LNTAALNGARGTAVDFGFMEWVTQGQQEGWNAASGRYKVKLDGEDGEKGKGKLVKVKAVNVEGEDGARFGPEGIGSPGPVPDPQQAPGRGIHPRHGYDGQTIYYNPGYQPPPASPGGNPKYKWDH